MLREFFMEHWLESHRQAARYNLGESGHAPRTVSDLVNLSGVGSEAACDRFLAMSLHDSPNWGREDLRAQIAGLHPGAEISNVLVTTGTSEALFLLFRALQPKKVALIVPAFQLLYEIPESLGAEIIPLKLEWDTQSGKPLVPWDEWMAELRLRRPDTVVINHPHNPSGIKLTIAEIQELQEVCVEIDAWLIGDEHYRFLADSFFSQQKASQTLGPTVYRKTAKIFVTGSFVKCTGTPGLRIGWCVGPTKILEQMQSEKNYITHTVNPLSEWLATIVLKNLNSELWKQLRAEVQQNAKALEDFLRNSRSKERILGAVPSGGLVCMMTHPQISTDQHFQKLCDLMLNRGLFMLPLTSMECGRWHLAPSAFSTGFGFRVGLGIAPKKFGAALSLLESCLQDYPF